MTSTTDACVARKSGRGLGLGGKFILLVAGILSVTLGSLTLWTVQAEKRLFQEHLEEKARMLGHFVALISPDVILAFDYMSLEHFVREITAQRDVVYGTVRDPLNNPMTSYLDKNNPLVAEVLRQAKDANDVAGVMGALMERADVLHMQFPIYSPHDADLLGEMIVGVDTARLQAQARATLWRGTGAGAAIIVFLSLAIYLVFRYSALRPIHTLTEASARVAAGDLEQPIRVFARDELGKLSQCFNIMMGKLRQAMQDKDAAMRELHELNRTLEERVRSRTAELAKANAEITSLNARLHAENLRMGAELEITRRLQQMVLPKQAELQAIQGLDIAGFMEPAEEVGGDYYDVLQHEGRVKIGIGDVTGHGLESGVLMLMVQMAVRTLLASNITQPEEFLRILNHAIFDNIKRMETDKNLTLALLDYQCGILHLTGQHEEILVVRRDRTVERLDTIDLGFMVGLQQDIAPFVHHSQIRLEVGDGVVLYTDGLTEARDPRGHMYGVERLCRVVGDNWQRGAQDIQEAVIADLRAHLGGLRTADDITLLVLKQR